MLQNQSVSEPSPANDVQSDALARTTPSGFPLVVLLVIVGLLGIDMVADALHWGGALHVALEAVMALTLVVAIGVLWRRFRHERALANELGLRLGAARTELASTSESLQSARAEADLWRVEAKKAAAGLASAIDQTFSAWGLSRGEAEVGFLLIKGLALKEIADLRGTSERTVRDQAGAIYRKAGLGGRAELSAFFLEDLLPQAHARLGVLDGPPEHPNI